MIPGAPPGHEIHVYDPGGKPADKFINQGLTKVQKSEIGVWDERGWTTKHGHDGKPPKGADKFENELKALSTDHMERAGTLPKDDNDRKKLFSNSETGPGFGCP